jgi:hypothetical protein
MAMGLAENKLCIDLRYNSGYTLVMKTAVSIPDPVFAAAESAAARLSMSRSQLYTRAIRDFLESHSSQDITQRLDRTYADNPSALDRGWMEMQRRSLAGDSW